MFFSPLKYDQSMIRSPDDAKRKVNATAYRNYLNRDGPRALGSKEIPQVTGKAIKEFLDTLLVY